MSDYDIPPPAPKEVDEKTWFELKDVLERATLKGHPYKASPSSAEERCDSCLYYLNPDDEISYCWHPTLRILVGGGWWCQWWEAIPEETT